jgi:hypothetical protein
MKRDLLVRIGLVITSALLLLNMASCILARTCANGQLCIVPLPGAKHVIDAGDSLSIWTPSVGFAERGLIFIYSDLPQAGEQEWPPFAYRVNHGGPYAILSLAYWPPLVLIGVPSVFTLWIRRRRRRERQKNGWCLHCGYNLTGNTGGMCPECGGKAKPPREGSVA